MRIEEIIDSASQAVDALKDQAKKAQIKAKEAGARLRLNKAQQSFLKTVNQTNK